MSLYQNDGREKYGEGKEELMFQSRQNHASDMVEAVLWYGHVQYGCYVMGSLVFIDDVTADRSRKKDQLWFHQTSRHSSRN